MASIIILLTASVATLSHELRTPLTSIIGWARLLESGSLNQEESVRGLRIIQRNSVAQSKLIEDLLDVSRIITGKLHLELATISLADITQLLVNGMRPSIEGKSLEILMQIDPDAGPIKGEEIHKSIPDVIVSDIGMPYESGYDLIRRLRSLDPDQRGRIPAIALTAYAGHDDRRRALLAGFQTHLAKPVSPDELIAAITNLAGR